MAKLGRTEPPPLVEGERQHGSLLAQSTRGKLRRDQNRRSHSKKNKPSPTNKSASPSLSLCFPATPGIPAEPATCILCLHFILFIFYLLPPILLSLFSPAQTDSADIAESYSTSLFPTNILTAIRLSRLRSSLLCLSLCLNSSRPDSLLPLLLLSLAKSLSQPPQLSSHSPLRNS